MSQLSVFFGDNLKLLRNMASNSIDLIYIDPPFNTGKIQKRTQIKTIQAKDDEESDRFGYGNRRYKTVKGETTAYNDSFDNFLGFLEPRLIEAYRILKENGSLFFHLDYREIHYCKLLLDAIFGRSSFMNEIIWSYDYGARSKSKWSAKHDNILWYAKNPENYTYNYDDIDRIPYLAPELVGEEKAKRGKTLTDVWWHTIVSPNGKEKTGYVTQKPLGILNRIVKVHSNPGDMLCDFFAGSGSFGEAAYSYDRNCILADSNIQSIQVMRKRFEKCDVKWLISEV